MPEELRVTRHGPRTEASPPVFYYDLSSAEAYLAAERVHHALPVVAEWQPVLAARLPGDGAPLGRAEIERRAAARGLQLLRWPPMGSSDGAPAMLAATYAKQIGRVVAFSLAAFRQAFAGGRDLGERDTVLIAAAACEMHPTALLKALELGSVLGRLRAATEAAATAGVRTVPTVRCDGQVFSGDDGLEAAAARLRL